MREIMSISWEQMFERSERMLESSELIKGKEKARLKNEMVVVQMWLNESMNLISEEENTEIYPEFFSLINLDDYCVHAI